VKIKVLLVEDNPGDARLLREMFREDRSLELAHVECMADAENYLAAGAVDVILLDLGLSDAQGLEAVRRALAAAPRIPLMVLTGLDDVSLAVQALQEGAQDYLVKGQIESRGLVRSVRYAIERKIMDDALFIEKERAQVTLDCIGDAVICTDTPGNITLVNVVAETLTGWPRQDAIGRPLGDVFRVTEVALNRALIRRDGVELPIEHTIATINDRGGLPTGAVIVFRDVSVARAMSLQMIHTAQHDSLTELPNRSLLNERIAQAIVLAQRHHKQVAVLYLDLDGFKDINDSLGHLAGDKLLQSVAKRLLDRARASDTVSRQGGDEFVVLLSEIRQADDAGIAAHRMLEAVARPHSIDEHQVCVSTSIGVSIYPADGLDAETLIKNADAAMYQAKQIGPQRYQYFQAALNAARAITFATSPA
jgi:diguanylate cyclase (GGDEF)-like protein